MDKYEVARQIANKLYKRERKIGTAYYGLYVYAKFIESKRLMDWADNKFRVHFIAAEMIHIGTREIDM